MNTAPGNGDAKPCDCTSVNLRGMNTRTPIRPFKPLYVSKPLISTDVAKISQHYGLRCKGENDAFSFRLKSFKIKS